MTFDELLAQVLDLLQREGRVSYRALKRRFDLDDNDLEDLKDEIIAAKQLASDEQGRVLVWTGDSAAPQATARLPDRGLARHVACTGGPDRTVRGYAARARGRAPAAHGAVL